MSPIKGVSDVRRLPRLGKLHLGEKVTEKGKTYPRATDYFVVPDEIKGCVGDKPKQLRIMFPLEDPEMFAPQYLKCYSMTQGLICRGDGIKCTRKVDVDTGDIAGRTTERWEYHEMTCDPDTCPEAVGDKEREIKVQCRRVMNLLFFLPEVPGLGVWQLDTSSFFSIVNINSCLDVIRGLCGRVSGIPLSLSLEPREVTPSGMKKKTIRVLHLRSNLRLAELQKLAALPIAALAVPEAEDEEPPEDLFPGEVLEEAEERREKKAEEVEEPLVTAAPPVPERDPETIKTINELFRCCYDDWGMQPKEVLAALGKSSQSEISDLPSECYGRIAATPKEKRRDAKDTKK